MKRLFSKINIIFMIGITFFGVSVQAQQQAFTSNFQNAAEEFAIPIDLLHAISFINTRMVDRQGVSQSNHSHTAFNQLLEERGIEGSPDYFGIMGLTDAQVNLAAELLNLSADTIKNSNSENIRAAAILLSEEVETQFGGIDVALNLADYYTVVAKFAGYGDAALELQYANEVFSVLRKGVKQAGQSMSSGEPLYMLAPVAYENLRPQLPENLLPVEYRREFPAGAFALDSRIDGTVAGTYVQASSYGSRSGKSIQRIVLHTCEGSGSGCVNYLKTNDRSVSAHYVVLESGAVTQMVQEKDKAHHVGCCNSDSIGIEHGGYAHNNTWTESQLQASFALICDIAKRNNLPVSRSAIQSHAELDPSRRTDPGPYYPWDQMLSEVQACVSGQPTAKSDLSITQLTWTPSAPKIGDAVTFKAVVNNATAATGANVGISFMINNQQVGFDATTPLGANSQYSFTIREPWDTTQSGQFTITAEVDDMNIVSESNEANNSLSKTITIAGSQTTQKPELAISDISWSPATIKAGDSVTLYAKVNNSGPSVQETISTAFYVEQQMVGSATISGLNSGQTQTFTLQGQWRPSAAGNFKITASVDELNRIEESNEANNVMTETATVSAASDGGGSNGGGGGCASESLLKGFRNGAAMQQNLRSFRDEQLGQSATGQRISELYYKHTDEIKAMMKKDITLKIIGLRLIFRTIFAFNPKQVEKDIIPLNNYYAKMAISFMERAQSKGSEDLNRDFDELKVFVEQFRGLTAKELLQEIRTD